MSAPPMPAPPAGPPPGAFGPPQPMGQQPTGFAASQGLPGEESSSWFARPSAPDRDSQPAQAAFRPPRFEPPEYQGGEPAGFGEPDFGQRQAYRERDSFGDPEGARGRPRLDPPTTAEPSLFDQPRFQDAPRFAETPAEQTQLDGPRIKDVPGFGEPPAGQGRFERSRFEQASFDQARFDDARSDGPRPEGGRFGDTRFDDSWGDGPREQPRSGQPRFGAGPDDATIRREDMPSPHVGMPTRAERAVRDDGIGGFGSRGAFQQPGFQQGEARPGFQGGPGTGYPQRDGYGDPRGSGQGAGWGPGTAQPGPFGVGGPPGGQGAFTPDRPARAAAGPAERKGGRKTPLLIGAGALIVVVGVGAAVAVPRVFKHTDPGCSAYASTALPAYNHAITDLNAQASQATLSTDISAAITQLTGAINQAQSATVKTALQGLLTQLTQVQGDVKKGAVPAATVSSLNAASSAADNAC